MKRIKRIKNVRLHREGTDTLLLSLGLYVAINGLLFFLFRHSHLWPFYIVRAITAVLCLIIINFFRCPIRLFNGETTNTFVATSSSRA